MKNFGVVVALVFLDGCAHRPTGYSGKPLVTLDQLAYDGKRISGQLRVEAKEGPISFDGRLIENVSLYIRSVRECATGKQLPRHIEDYFPPPPSFEDLVTVRPGYFYGTQVEYIAFNKEAGPDCIDVTFSFHSGVKPTTASGEAAITARFQKTAPLPQ